MVLESIIRELFHILVYIRGKGGSLLRFVLYVSLSVLRREVPMGTKRKVKNNNNKLNIMTFTYHFND